ncbi:CRM-domain containing factor CFM3 chloroplastic/mitochondrial [Bienertia sinuspersici]
MVAISLYRGNLHRIPPDVVRRWLMPTPSLSLKDFRSLLFRRSKALSLLPSSSSITIFSNPNPSPNLNPNPTNSSSANLDPPENPTLCPQPCTDGNENVVTDDEKEKRKSEVEQKLHILNEKKHNLVQALKQILNAEEE